MAVTVAFCKGLFTLQACKYMGNIQFQLEEYEKAEISFKKTIKIDPNFGKAFYGLGMIFVNKDDVHNQPFKLSSCFGCFLLAMWTTGHL